MKFTKLFAAAAVAAVAMGSQSAWAATESTEASAAIVAPVEIAEDSALSFGKIAPTATAGTVALSASASPIRTPDNVVLASGGTVTAAKYTISGESGSTVAIVLPTSASTLERDGGEETMTVNNFVDNSLEGLSVYTLGATGVEILVGATLNVGANQAAGIYTGTFSISVDYN